MERNGPRRPSLPRCKFERFLDELALLRRQPADSPRLSTLDRPTRRAFERLGLVEAGRAGSVLLRTMGTTTETALKSEAFIQQLRAVYGANLINTIEQWSWQDLQVHFAKVPRTYRHKVLRFLVLVATEAGLRVSDDAYSHIYRKKAKLETLPVKANKRDLLLVYRTYRLLDGRIAQVQVMGDGELENAEAEFLARFPPAPEAPGAKRRSQSG